MAAGHGVRREDVMYNDFVIVGPGVGPGRDQRHDQRRRCLQEDRRELRPPSSPAATNPARTPRRNRSGRKADIEPAGDWYISAGQGMGEVLTMANEQQAYTLSDRATYLARSKAAWSWYILVEGDKALFNPYGVIAVNPDKNPKINAELAGKFIDWIISVPVQEKIKTFGLDEYGQSLFVPSSKPYLDSQSGLTPVDEVAISQWVSESRKPVELRWIDIFGLLRPCQV